MAQIVTKYAAKKLLGKQMEKYRDKDVAGDYDPFYAYVEHPTKKGKKIKVKRQIPDYIPEHDAIILAKMRQRAYWLDVSLFDFMGIRFGWSSVIGLIPAFGDAVDAALAMLLVYRCSKIECGLGGYLLQMLFNVALDFFIGLVPFVGDLGDALFRANSRNVRLLEKALDKAYKPKTLPKDKDDAHTATVYEEFSDDGERLPRHRQDVEPRRDELRRPEPARIPTETRGGERPSRKATLKKSDSRRERR